MEYIFLIQVVLMVAFFATYNTNERLAEKILGAFFFVLGFGLVFSVYSVLTMGGY